MLTNETIHPKDLGQLLQALTRSPETVKELHARLRLCSNCRKPFIKKFGRKVCSLACQTEAHNKHNLEAWRKLKDEVMKRRKEASEENRARWEANLNAVPLEEPKDKPNGSDHNQGKLLYTTHDAALALGISHRSIYQYMSSGLIKSIRIGGMRRIPKHEVMRLAEEGTGNTDKHYRRDNETNRQL